MKTPHKYLTRQPEITELFLQVLNAHIDDFMAGRVEEMFHIKDIASIMCLHPVHVSSVIKLHTGLAPCHFFEQRIFKEAKLLLAIPELSINQIAIRLTYDPSNFTKFFKEFSGITPSAYRKWLNNENVAAIGMPPLNLVA